MLQLLWLIPALPFFSYAILAIFGKRISRNGVAALGVGSVGTSAILTILLGISFLTSPPANYAFSQTLWKWMDVAGFSPGITFYLDSLSLVFIFVITFVGFLIHLYSSEFMQGDEGYSRFFAYMNLFVGSMLTLVLADNLLLLYLGWEGVGLCSYLLIGFWYQEPENGYAARKAFIVTRVGDAAFAVGLFLLFQNLGTLDIQNMLQRADAQWIAGSTLPVAAALLLLGGAVGKSAQLPLQTWLPDAMAGPTPVSALIHAATMVTAGVYLIARTYVIFQLAPVAMLVVAIIGAATLLLAGFSAITQVDIKRVLAYSTISQIGYMMLALGVGAWAAGIFHFMIHAFFKALLFLGAGVVIITHHHEHNMFKMGGLRKQLPVTFWTFLIASGALAAIPIVTAGFYSKDAIIWYAWSAEGGSTLLWVAALVGAFLTAIYTFRMVFITFFGEEKMPKNGTVGFRLKLPLVVLAVLSVIGGFINLPHTFGKFTPLFNFLEHTLPAIKVVHESLSLEFWFELISAVTALLGLYLAYYFFFKRTQFAERFNNTAVGAAIHRFWFTGWGFDWIYDRLLVFPFVWLARINRRDFIDLFYDGVAWTTQLLHKGVGLTQTGRIRWYAMGIALGAVISIALGVFL